MNKIGTANFSPLQMLLAISTSTGQSMGDGYGEQREKGEDK